MFFFAPIPEYTVNPAAAGVFRNPPLAGGGRPQSIIREPIAAATRGGGKRKLVTRRFRLRVSISILRERARPWSGHKFKIRV